MAIQRVGHVVLKMRDLEKAKQFYHGVLGMKIGKELPWGIFFRKEHGVEIVGTTDHKITKNLYIKDPEGNTIEIYAEVPEYDWRAEGMGGIAQPFDIEAVPASA